MSRRKAWARLRKADDFLIQKVAHQFLSYLGSDAIAYLQEQAGIAADLGDELSARAWTDLAEAAAIISEHQAAA